MGRESQAGGRLSSPDDTDGNGGYANSTYERLHTFLSCSSQRTLLISTENRLDAHLTALLVMKADDYNMQNLLHSTFAARLSSSLALRYSSPNSQLGSTRSILNTSISCVEKERLFLLLPSMQLNGIFILYHITQRKRLQLICVYKYEDEMSCLAIET